MYERAIAAFPDALLEDAHDLPEVAALLAGEGHRISYDAPIHSVADIDAAAAGAARAEHQAVPGRRPALAARVYDECAARGLLMYGGGMGELDVGRDQIQLLASLFHPDGPNDTAPSGYNADTPGRRRCRRARWRRTRRRWASGAAEAVGLRAPRGGASTGRRRARGPRTSPARGRARRRASDPRRPRGGGGRLAVRAGVAGADQLPQLVVGVVLHEQDRLRAGEDLGGLDRLRAGQPVPHPPGPPVARHHAGRRRTR